MRNMPQQLDELLVVLRNREVALNQLVELISLLPPSVVGEILSVEDLYKPLPGDPAQMLPLKVCLPLNSPPLMGYSLELIYCKSNLVLLGALHSLERVLQLMRPALYPVWIVLTKEHWRSETQEPLKKSGPVFSDCHPPPVGPAAPGARRLPNCWLLHLWVCVLLRLLLLHYWGRCWGLTTCCRLPRLPSSLIPLPEELLCHGKPVRVLLWLRLVLLLLLPTD
ncbi:hypothetical protein Taro_051957 [Colocasia esculenta]|uniref:Uncharacterized protein n=1 Tax=Colocasia esculenta TaxID=4460 RepID=A0A843XIK2_COLES|nr:hypothetical protein [Colocasia esculenta]